MFSSAKVGLIRLRHSWKYFHFVFLLVSAEENERKIKCYQQAGGEDGSAKGGQTCQTSEMCVRKTTSVLLFLQYHYNYTLACEDKLEKDDKEILDELTENDGCTKLVKNNDGGCMTKMVKGKYVEFCCCNGNK